MLPGPVPKRDTPPPSIGQRPGTGSDRHPSVPASPRRAGSAAGLERCGASGQGAMSPLGRAVGQGGHGEGWADSLGSEQAEPCGSIAARGGIAGAVHAARAPTRAPLPGDSWRQGQCPFPASSHRADPSLASNALLCSFSWAQARSHCGRPSRSSALIFLSPQNDAIHLTWSPPKTPDALTLPAASSEGDPSLQVLAQGHRMAPAASSPEGAVSLIEAQPSFGPAPCLFYGLWQCPR